MMIENPRKRRGRPPRSEISSTAAILQAALQTFAEHGYDGTNLRQIAASAAIDVALISHRFGSKLELWKAVVDAVADRVMPAIVLVPQHDQPPASDGVRLHHAMEQLIDIICDTPQLAMFMVKEIADRDERFEYVHERLGQPLHDVLAPLIAAARASGDIRDFDPDFFMFAFTGAIAIIVAVRPFVARFSAAAENEVSFRAELKKMMLFSLQDKTRTC
jgi:AcrR family transcriptional regulator